jgi:hypothetical protein
MRRKRRFSTRSNIDAIGRRVARDHGPRLRSCCTPRVDRLQSLAVASTHSMPVVYHMRHTRAGSIAIQDNVAESASRVVRPRTRQQSPNCDRQRLGLGNLKTGHR